MSDIITPTEECNKTATSVYSFYLSASIKYYYSDEYNKISEDPKTRAAVKREIVDFWNLIDKTEKYNNECKVKSMKPSTMMSLFIDIGQGKTIEERKTSFKLMLDELVSKGVDYIAQDYKTREYFLALAYYINNQTSDPSQKLIDNEIKSFMIEKVTKSPYFIPFKTQIHLDGEVDYIDEFYHIHKYYFGDYLFDGDTSFAAAIDWYDKKKKMSESS